MKATKVILKISLVYGIYAIIFGIFTGDFELLLLYILISLTTTIPIGIIFDLLMEANVK